MAILNKDNFDLPISYCIGKAHTFHSPMFTIIYHNAFDVVHTDLWDSSPQRSKNCPGMPSMYVLPTHFLHDEPWF